MHERSIEQEYDIIIVPAGDDKRKIKCKLVKYKVSELTLSQMFMMWENRIIELENWLNYQLAKPSSYQLGDKNCIVRDEEKRRRLQLLRSINRYISIPHYN